MIRIRSRGPDAHASNGMARRARVLILVQNLPVPFDRRVWLECRTLSQAGFGVAVVCPKGPGDPSYAVLDGVELYKYRPYSSKGKKASFLVEYLYSFAATLYLSIKAAAAGRFTVVQSCNPPDIFWPIGLLWRLLHGSRFVFDHHDLCPETYACRFPNGPRIIYRLLVFLEGATTRCADRVIATNDSYRRLVVERHGIDPDRVTVVRTGPDPERLKRGKTDPTILRKWPHMAAYIGVMGPQDGVDLVLQLADIIINGLGRRDIGFVLIGSGDCFEELVAMRDRLKLEAFVEFTGRVSDEAVSAILSSADVGISPDPKNSMNEFCTMNKTMEYMAYELPVLAFDLHETRVSAGDAALYATPNDVGELARLVVDLIDDQARRQVMGATGRARIEQQLAWSHQARRYLDLYESLVAQNAPRLVSAEV